MSAERVADGLLKPTALVDIPNGDALVAELPGAVRYLDRPDAILDLSDQIGEIEGEQGLLGMAIHPDYPADARLFVSYTRADDASVVASYDLPADGSPVEGPERRVLVIPQPSTLHNGGHIAFGPEGYLYVALGDGGPNGDPHAEGQNRYTLLGSVLRIDVSGARPYQVPPDNPFAEGGGAPEVWAYGLRNPWRFSFDRDTGDLWIGDVGASELEEINVVPAGRGGLNFGWSRYEGSLCYRPHDCGAEGISMPAYEYARDDGPRGVVGGYVYRGSQIASLVGHYIYGDIYGSGIWALDPENPSLEPKLVLDWREVFVSFAEDSEGELYVLAFNEGAVYRLVPEPADASSPAP